MSMNETQNIEKNGSRQEQKIRVHGFIDGFNLYHALNEFRNARIDEDRFKYKKYKWLCLRSLLSHYIDPRTESLEDIEYFTSYPSWDSAKQDRHKRYVSALIHTGVKVTFGEFKRKTVTCRGLCKTEFQTFEEKQTDVNISMAMLGRADKFDKAILLTEDSDQVPAVKLLKQLHPSKKIFTLAPIGRGGKELRRVCDGTYHMNETILQASQLPNPIEIKRSGKGSIFIVKPNEWTSLSDSSVTIQIAASKGE